MFASHDAVAEIRSALSRVASAFDPAILTPEAAAAVVTNAAAIESRAATVKALAAKRVAATTPWRRDGDRTPAHHLARTTGTTVGEARELLDAAARLEALPQVDAAARRGELSARQVAVISDAAATAPDAESRLIETARHASLGELRDECARTKAAALPDAEARHRAIHAGRFARRRSCPDGGAEILYRSTADEVAVVWGVVERYREKAFARARLEGERESFDAYAADALLAMARAAVGGAGDTIAPRKGADAKVIVRIDHAALVRGRTEGDEVCEIAGLGPIAVSAVREMVASGDAFVAAVVTKGTDIASIVHLGRRPIALQRTALEWCSPTCSVLGCNQVAGLQIDHRLDWAETLHTTLRELDPLCMHHHNLKTRENWQLVAGTGKRRIVPPGHPDHPDARAGPRVPLTV
jgi:hypothetical protein